nr:LysR family transcriptional regulator [uncultured Rhodoferax sp.]
MNITFRQLRTFLALAEQGSVTAAARAMHVTQPTVSMQLKEIADSVGLPLYEVTGKRLQLTEAGRDLEATARAMLHEWDLFEQGIAALRGLKAGRLRLAVVSTAKYFTPRLLGDFCRMHPEVEISLEVLNRDGVVQRLRDNVDDLYIMSKPPADIDAVAHAFLANPLVLIAPQSHPLALHKGIALPDLHADRFLLREKGSGTRLSTDAHFSAHHFVPRIRLEMGSNEALKQAVAGGLGLSVVSRHALGPDVAGQGLAVLDVKGFPIISNWYTVHLQGKRLSPLAEAFMGYLARFAAAG